jgi:azurin
LVTIIELVKIKFLIPGFVVVVITFSLLLNASFSTSQQSGLECTNPTFEVEIKSLVGIKYNLQEIQVPKNTCVKITLVNEDPDIPHDFTINSESGENGIEAVTIEVNGGETASFNVVTPDTDTIFVFYCSLPGHRAAGEEGDFIVGEGHISSSSVTEEESSSQDNQESDSVSLPGFSFTDFFFMNIAMIILLKNKNRSC